MKDGITIYSKKATGRLPTVRDLELSSKASEQSATQDSDKKVCSNVPFFNLVLAWRRGYEKRLYTAFIQDTGP